MSSIRNNNFTPITSASNPHIRHVTTLLTKARTRRDEQCFVIEGLRIFLDTPDRNIEEIFVSESVLGELGSGEPQTMAGPKSGDTRRASAFGSRELQDMAGQGSEDSQRAVDLSRLAYKLRDLADHGIPVNVIPDELMEKISDTKTPQGVLAIVRTPQYSLEDLMGEEGTSGDKTEKAATPFLLILENIQDPGNLGTMIRTAEAAGVTGIYMSRGTVDITNPKTVRATMSAIFRMPFRYAEDDKSFDETLRKLKERGVVLYAAHLKGTKSYDCYDYRTSAGLLIGNEGNGLSDRVAALADAYTIIPMQGQIESLNAAMAAGILMYEVARQRRGAESRE